jgi:hypothetical protein
MNLGWLLRMSRWSRRPPSSRQVVMVLGVIALCLVLFAIETIWGWPDALTVTPTQRVPRP